MTDKEEELNAYYSLFNQIHQARCITLSSDKVKKGLDLIDKWCWYQEQISDDRRDKEDINIVLNEMRSL